MENAPHPPSASAGTGTERWHHAGGSLAGPTVRN